MRLSPVKETFIMTSIGKYSSSDLILICEGFFFHHFSGVCVCNENTFLYISVNSVKILHYLCYKSCI